MITTGGGTGSTMTGEAESPDPEREAAAAALAALNSAVRQRHAELAVIGVRGNGVDVTLAELHRLECVPEPQPVSPRPGIGRLIVFTRKLVYHLFAKWHSQAVLQQQNEFNQTTASILAALVEREREGRRELHQLRARLDKLETRQVRPPNPPQAAS